MPVTRNALLRYRTIDRCLQNRYRKWLLEDLIQACSDALYEYEGLDKEISRRTIQMDIQAMRSDKLGYNAPIIVIDKKYYTYEDPKYSITNNPLSKQDLNKLSEAVDILKQFKGFSHFQELSGMVQSLEDKVYAAKTHQETVIDFEKNDNLKGLEYIDILYKNIINKSCIRCTYQSFKARTSNTFIFHPYLLKEYRNRWFVLGIKKKNEPMLNLALDRIIQIESCNQPYIPCRFDLSDYFKDILGVSVNHGFPPENVVLFFDFATAPYVLTKPIHHSQVLVEKQSHGVIISLQVQINYELEREILGFGDRVQVIGPEKLKRKVKETFNHALDLYNSTLNPAGIKATFIKTEYKGSAVLQNIFTKREVNKIKKIIYDYSVANSETQNIQVHAIRQLLINIPELQNLIFNRNIKKILSQFGENFFMSKAIFFDKPPQSNWYVTWHQDCTIHVHKKIETEGYSGWTKKEKIIAVCPPEEILKNTLTIRIHLDDTDEKNGALKVVHGSHHQRLKDEEILLIGQNCFPQICEVNEGGLHIMKPLLLHSSSKTLNQKHRRVIHLEFTSMDLPNGLEWAEKIRI